MLPHVNTDFFKNRRPHEETPLKVPSGLLFCLESKIVFLNSPALANLEGYKATVRLCKSGELHLILTGWSPKGAKALYDSLQAMNPEEVYGH